MKKKICIVVSTYNKDITEKSLRFVKNFLIKEKIRSIKIIKVPGSFEIPVAISRNLKRYDAFVAIGCIIKGETENFNLISSSITNGLMELSIISKKPIGNAILTCFKKTQAQKRISKGVEAAKAVIKVLKNA